MEIYHERQRLQFCLLHALNNLQGHENFTKKDLDSIADKLESETGASKPFLFRKHRNIFTGNYDVNVFIAACNGQGMDVRWHDKRSSVSDSDLSQAELVGVIVNTEKKNLQGWWKGRHWLAVRMVDGEWYNLDSDLPKPVKIHNPRELFNGMMKNEEAEVFFVSKMRT